MLDCVLIKVQRCPDPRIMKARLFSAQIKEIIKAPPYSPFFGDSTGNAENINI